MIYSGDQKRLAAPPAPDPEDRFVAELYLQARVPLDALAYTDEFEHMFSEFRSRFSRPDDDHARREMLHRLLTLRKRGQLPRLRDEDREIAGNLGSPSDSF